MSDSDEEDTIIAVASATVALAACYYESYISKTPCWNSTLSGAEYVRKVLNGHGWRCQKKFRMGKHAFLRLCHILQTKGLLSHSNGIRVEEQVAMFMLAVGHNKRNRLLQKRFQHSGETISRHFNNVLNAIMGLSGDFLQPARSTTSPEILQDHRFLPYFKDCVGAIDGTRIPAFICSNEKVPFTNRKGEVTQNVMVACAFDLQFQYVLAGWEGSSTDSHVLDSALTRANKLHVPEGKYYLVDGKYGNEPGFVAPYCDTRYHLKEYDAMGPKNCKELFNLRHSSLRNVVERAIGILKSRFPILTVAPPYPFETQVKLVIACCILHNHIRREKTNDVFFEMAGCEEQDRFEFDTENMIRGPEDLHGTTEQEVASQLRRSIADAMWSDYQKL